MTLAIVPVDLFLTRKLTNEQLAVIQSRELETDIPATAAFHIVRNVLRDMPFMISVASNEKEGLLTYKTRPMFLSFGEKLIVEVKARVQSKAIIKVTSHPKIKTSMIDFGRNFKNAEEITRKIQSSLKS